MLYSAELRLPWWTPAVDKRAKALAVLEELGLSHVAHSRIGEANEGGGGGGGGGMVACIAGCLPGGGGSGGTGSRGVSGGERRRTVVGRACLMKLRHKLACHVTQNQGSKCA